MLNPPIVKNIPWFFALRLTNEDDHPLPGKHMLSPSPGGINGVKDRGLPLPVVERHMAMVEYCGLLDYSSGICG